MTSRPVRNARLTAQQNILAYNEDESADDVDPYGEDMLDIVEEAKPEYAEQRRTRSGRNVRPPEKYKGEDEFEERMAETSPVLRHALPRGGRLRRRVADPDDEDGQGLNQPPPVPARNAFPTRATRSSLGAGPSYTNGKNVDLEDHHGSKRAKSRHSSADAESFEPSGSGTEGDQSLDPLHRAFDEEEEEPESQSPSPMARRTTRSAARRSRRQPARGEHDSPKRQLRQRTSKVNYELPPLDVSADIVQDAIEAARRPNGRKMGIANKGLPWGSKGRDMAQAMGDPDTSDSVGRLRLAAGFRKR